MYILGPTKARHFSKITTPIDFGDSNTPRTILRGFVKTRRKNVGLRVLEIQKRRPKKKLFALQNQFDHHAHDFPKGPNEPKGPIQ